MIKPKPWDGRSLSGEWLVTRKLDGVRAIRAPSGYVSRRGKPLHNLGHLLDGGPDDAEVFLGSLSETVTAVRTVTREVTVHREHLYSLDPPDPRLVLGVVTDPGADEIRAALAERNALGDEGLVLRRGDTWLKVKRRDNHDVVVTAVVEGTGKYVGMLGAFETAMGRVGTGFSDDDRVRFFTPDMVGETIEVSCMELTEDGKFRLPVFVRHRFDK